MEYAIKTFIGYDTVLAEAANQANEESEAWLKRVHETVYPFTQIQHVAHAIAVTIIDRHFFYTLTLTVTLGVRPRDQPTSTAHPQ